MEEIMLHHKTDFQVRPQCCSVLRSKTICLFTVTHSFGLGRPGGKGSIATQNHSHSASPKPISPPLPYQALLHIYSLWGGDTRGMPPRRLMQVVCSVFMWHRVGRMWTLLQLHHKRRRRKHTLNVSLLTPDIMDVCVFVSQSGLLFK